MKKYLLPLLALPLALLAGDVNYNVTLNSATAIAATTANATPGTAHALGNKIPNGPYRLTVRGTGTAATTNGSLTVYLSLSPDGTNFDTALQSGVQLAISSMGAATVQKSDLFYLAGAQAVRVGHIANTFSGPVSNMVIQLNYVAPQP